MDRDIDLRTILERYAAAERGRATGGLNALAGFDFQLRHYIAAAAEALAQTEAGAQDATGLMEALSDLTLPTADDSLVCVQVKRTLNRATLLAAAREAKAIDAFMAREFPAFRDRLRFGIVAQRGELLAWSSLSTAEDVAEFVAERNASGHLQPPRIEADPDARTLRALWNVLPDPCAFLDRALNHCLAIGVGPQAAPDLRDALIRDFCAARAAAPGEPMPGEWLTPASFALDAHPSNRYAVGSRITLPRYRDAQYMTRPQLLDPLMQGWLAPLRDSRAPRDKLDVFWLQGRSGAGKSALLLQLLERLVADGLNVLWLDDNDAALETVLHLYQHKGRAAPHALPDVIAVDDLHAPGKRATNHIRELARWIDQQGLRDWPRILTCGPDDLARDFDQDCAGEGFALHTATVPQVEAEESRRLRAWYEQRFHAQAATSDAAFAQAERENAGLFVSMAVELAEGDLRAFARRFADRIRHAGLDQALAIPLALNRLYLTAPHAWLSRNARERLDALNRNQDFQLAAEGAEQTRSLRLTHPHLADAIYRALRTPATPLAYSHDLDAAFKQAMAEDAPELAFGLLQQCAHSEGVLAQRVAELDRSVIAHWPGACLEWLQEHPAHLLWSRHWRLLEAGQHTLSEPEIQALHRLGVDWATAPLHAQRAEWSFVFQALLARAPQDTALHALGYQWLTRPGHDARADWAFVWRALLDHAADDTDLLRLGRRWISQPGHELREDWSFVFQALLARAPDDAELQALGRSWLIHPGHEAREDWNFIYRDLLAQAQQDAELLTLGRAWLTRHEKDARDDWAFVYQALLAQAPDDATLHALGRQWLTRHVHDARDDWSHVWRALLAQAPNDAELHTLGRQRLTRYVHDARDDWAFVYQDLLAQAPDDAELHALGRQWLTRHVLDARDDWAFAYQALLTQAPDDAELHALGRQWLTRHVHDARDDWNYVWRALLAQAPDDAELHALGRRWLTRHLPDARDDWNYVWRALLAQAPDDAELHALGRQWLTRHVLDARDDWAFVYQALLTQAPDDAELHALGRQWLTRHVHDARDDWNYVWRAFLAQAPADSATLEIGRQWLATERRDEAASWEHVWKAWMQAAAGREEHQHAYQQLLAMGSQGQGNIEVGGIYRGWVNAHAPLGLFVMIGARSALLHEKHFPPDEDLRDRYPIGSHLFVRVISNDFDTDSGKSRLRLEYLLPMRLHRPGQD